MESERQAAAEIEPSRPAPAVAPAAAYARSVGELRGRPQHVLELQRTVGNRATTRVLRRLQAGARSLARIGYPLGVALPPGAPTPLKDTPDHREWNKSDFHAFWEQEQGRKLTNSEKKTIDRGCIGITANNLEGGGDPSLEEVYDDFDTAHAAMVKHNGTWWNTHVSSTKYIMFGMLFWSNQDPDESKRENPSPTAFRGDPSTHEIDMSDYRYRRKPGGVNFDYGFWDDSTNSFWHANHSESGPTKPMIVYQSTRNRFAKRYDMPDGSFRFGYAEFDRVAYGVAVANNYDPTKAGPKAAPAPATTSGPAPTNPYDMGPTFPF